MTKTLKHVLSATTIAMTPMEPAIKSVPAPISSEAEKSKIEMCCEDEMRGNDTEAHDNVIVPYVFKEGDVVSSIASSPLNKHDPSVSPAEPSRSVDDDDNCRISSNEVCSRRYQSNSRRTESSGITGRESQGVGCKRKGNEGSIREDIMDQQHLPQDSGNQEWNATNTKGDFQFQLI